MKRVIRVMTTAALATAWFTTAPAPAQDPQPMQDGVSIRVYDIGRGMRQLRPLVPGQTPNVSKIVPRIEFNGAAGDFPFAENFILVADGAFVIDRAGEYEFELTSDDGSVLWVSGQKVIDHDGEHGTTSKTGSIALERGLVPFELRYFQSAGEKNLWLKWKRPGTTEFELVPTRSLRAPKGEVRVTSPGKKRVILPLERGRPGDGRPLDGVHPSYDLIELRPEGFEPKVGGVDWLSDGRMVVCTWDPEGAVYLLDGVQGPNPDVTVKKIGAGLAEPLGLTVVDDRIFVLQKQELTELIDHDGDDVVDEYRCVSSGWNVTANFHEFAFGLVHQDGHFYANLAIAINPGGASTKPQISERGSVLKISMDGDYEIVAHGLRTPNGIGFGVDDHIYITDNQGDWLPVSKLLRLEEGAFFGSRAVMQDQSVELDVTPPVVWLPQGEIGNSPSEPAPLNDGPYAGQMIHGDVTHGGVKRVFIEEINGVAQGAVFRWTQGLEAGVNRISWGPDGCLYVGGIGSSGNWGQTGKKRWGLEKLRYTGRPTFEMLAVRGMANGVELEFTEPLAETDGWNPGAYFVERYRYEPTAAYGGPKIDQTQLPVKSATVSADRRKVFLELDGLEPDRVLYVRLIGPWKSAAGREAWTKEAWYTMNVVPADRYGEPKPSPYEQRVNTLTDQQRRAGWKLLFDGRTLDGWRGFRKDAPTDGWAVEDGCITLAKSGAGDLITEEQFENFMLELEWKVEPGGNSGIFFHVSEEGDWVWSTGPEMQVLDNERHPDGQNPFTSAGSCYALYAPAFDATYPPGAFNTVRITVMNNDVQFMLNGVEQARFTIGSEDWNQRIAASKFAGMPMFAKPDRGHIAIQDHGDRVWFRNIRIRPLP